MASVANIFIDQGSHYSAVITVVGTDGQPIDLEGYTADSQIRKYYGSSQAYCFTTTILEPLTAGKVRITLPGSVSQAMYPGRWLYDVRVVSASGKPHRVIEGVLVLSPQSTMGPCA